MLKREVTYDREFLAARVDLRDSVASENENKYPRTAGQIDRDRILYSGHFLRLAEVTQTISPVHGYVFHNRLSHSLKVGHVSRRLCERLKRRYADPTIDSAAIKDTHPNIRRI